MPRFNQYGLSLSGTYLDIIAFTDGTETDGFLFAVGSQAAAIFGIPGGTYNSGPSYGAAFEEFVPANYSLVPLDAATPTPVPAGLLVGLTVAPVLGLVARRRRAG